MDKKLSKQVERLLLNATIKTNDGSRNYLSNPSFIELEDLVADEPQNWKLVNQHALYLLKLSQQLSHKEVLALDKLLLSKIGDRYKEQIIDACTLYFVHSGKAEQLIDHLKQIFVGWRNNDGLIRGLECLRESMRHRPDLFSESITEDIYEWCDECLYGKSEFAEDIRQYATLYKETTEELQWLKNLANEILTQSFIRQIDSAFNPELNADEQKVIEKIESLGFPLDLTEALGHINSLIDQANTPMKYRDTMSSIRVFTERFYEQVAKAIDPTTKIDGKDSKEVSKFFKAKKLLSQDMAELVEAHRHFLSNDGTHRIKSRKEDARIAKNMTIEMSLYIITRLREIESSNK